MVNADRFILVSGHRSYFYGQKGVYMNEIFKLKKLLEESKRKKRKYKSSCESIQEQMDRQVARLENDIDNLRARVIISINKSSNFKLKN